MSMSEIGFSCVWSALSLCCHQLSVDEESVHTSHTVPTSTTLARRMPTHYHYWTICTTSLRLGDTVSVLITAHCHCSGHCSA